MWVAKASVGHDPLPFLISVPTLDRDVKNWNKDKGITCKQPNKYFISP